MLLRIREVATPEVGKKKESWSWNYRNLFFDVCGKASSSRLILASGTWVVVSITIEAEMTRAGVSLFLFSLVSCPDGEDLTKERWWREVYVVLESFHKAESTIYPDHTVTWARKFMLSCWTKTRDGRLQKSRKFHLLQMVQPWEVILACISKYIHRFHHLFLCPLSWVRVWDLLPLAVSSPVLLRGLF